MKKDSAFQIQKIGKSQIEKIDFYWIKYVANDQLKTQGILNYLKDNYSDKVFIIHCIVFGDSNADKRLCQLQNLMTTFRMTIE